MKKLSVLTLTLALFATAAFSQTDKFWSVNNESPGNIKTDKAVGRLSFPKAFKLFNVNAAAFRQELSAITGRNAVKHSTVISLPNADGSLEEFEVFEASNFEPDLQEKFSRDQGLFR
jgi:hypothetical protein